MSHFLLSFVKVPMAPLFCGSFHTGILSRKAYATFSFSKMKSFNKLTKPSVERRRSISFLKTASLLNFVTSYFGFVHIVFPSL